MKIFSKKIDKQVMTTMLLILIFVSVNISGFMLHRAWSADEDVDEPVEDLSLDEQHQASKALSSDKESLKRLFNVLDAGQAIDDSEALEKRGGEEDAKRVEDILSGNYSDEDLYDDGGAMNILSKISALTERSNIQSEIAFMSAISSYEASIWDQQTKLISDKMQELSKERDKISKQWFDDLMAADYSSSYLNNLPPD